MLKLNRKENNTDTKERSILWLLSATGRCISRKVKSIYKQLMKKEPKKTDNGVNNVENLQNKSIDELKGIAKLTRIKNRDELKKEDLIISLLKSESSNAERNYMKHLNNTTKDDNNTNDDGYNDTYNIKIRDIISDVRIILIRLGNTIINNNKKKIKKELYEKEKKQNLSDKEKEMIYDDLVELVRTLDKKEKYKYHDHDDLDYHGIRDIENLFDDIDDDDYYKPILVKSSFNENYKYYESRGDKDKKLSVGQYLDMIKPYLSDLINDHKTKKWKIQINMHVNFVSSNDTGETRTIFVWSDNEEIRLGNETDDIVKGLLNSFLNNYQKEEIVLRNGSNFVFESDDLLSYHLHKISLKRGKSHIKSPEWVLNKRVTINPKNKDNCFQYSITVALNHQNIQNHPERISNIKLFIDQYNWEGIDFPAGIKDWKKFEQNNKTIALNILFAPHNEKTINLAYKSKYNRKRENQVVLLMITNGEKWHYIALKSERTDDGFNRPIKSLSRLFRGITSNHDGDFYCLNCLHSFRTDNAPKKHERLCENNDYCYVEMLTKLNKILKYNHGEKHHS